MQKYIQEAKVLLALAIPVIIAQASQTAIAVIDTMMAGHFSPLDLSAVAVGTSIWLPTILFGHGILAVLTPTIAQLNGSSQRDKIAHQTRQGLWLALILSIGLMTLLYNSCFLFALKGDIEPELTDLSVNYLRAAMWGVPGYLFFQVYRNQCDGLSKTKPSMFIGFMALLFNVPINYILIYGKFGLPALGAIGCGIATAAAYWFMLIIMRIYTLKSPSLRDIRAGKTSYLPDWKTMKRLTELGLPIAFAIFFEVSLFAFVSILIAPLGVTAVAGHNITLSFSSLTFVIPLSLSIAASIRIGHQLGEKNTVAARDAAITCLSLSLTFAVIMASLIVLFRHSIPYLYTSDEAVIAISLQLLVLLAIYQCSDYVQVVGSGILRGYKDTKVIFMMVFIAYWVVGLPLGYILGLTSYLVPAMGPAGFWIGFIVGLTVSAILMISRVIWLQKQSIEWLLNKASR